MNFIYHNIIFFLNQRRCYIIDAKSAGMSAPSNKVEGEIIN